MQKYFYVGDFTKDLIPFFTQLIPQEVKILKAEVLMDENGYEYLYVKYEFDNGTNQVLERLINESFIDTVSYIAKRINKYYNSFKEVTKKLKI
jgi:hypothetical protein